MEEKQPTQAQRLVEVVRQLEQIQSELMTAPTTTDSSAAWAFLTIGNSAIRMAGMRLSGWESETYNALLYSGGK